MAPLFSLPPTPDNLSASSQEKPTLKSEIVEHPHPQTHLPIIDLSQLRGSDRRHAVEAIGRAAHKWGFFQVINHGVPKSIIEPMWRAYDELYALPRSERAQCDAQVMPQSILEKIKQFGLPPAIKTMTGPRDTMRFWKFDPDQADAINHAPDFFRGPALEYYKTLRCLGEEILGALSQSLGLDTDYLYKITGQNPKVNSSIHLYAPDNHPDVPIGLLAHTDIDTLTVLMQDETDGLQVLKDDNWVNVRPLPDSFVVNIGEAIQIITNGKYPSVQHRVVNDPHQRRRSISCFLCPTDEATFGPLPQCTSEDNPPRYKHESFANHIYNYVARSFK